MGRAQNLKPRPKGVSGNPGARPKKKPLTDELERLLHQEAPGAKGKAWAAVIAEALLRQASKGDMKAIVELFNRIEGKPLQAAESSVDVNRMIVERLQAARKRRNESKE